MVAHVAVPPTLGVEVWWLGTPGKGQRWCTYRAPHLGNLPSGPLNRALLAAGVTHVRVHGVVNTYGGELPTGTYTRQAFVRHYANW